MILAAGLGTRLRPLTDKIPKPMLPIGNKPLLEYQLRLLKKFGVKDCAMNLYCLPEMIMEYFGDGKKFGMTIKYSKEAELMGTAGALKKISEFFDQPFFVFYGDNLTNINLDNLAKFHRKKGGLVTIALYYEEHPESKGIVEMDSDARIVSFKEKPKSEEITTNWANAGIYLCESEVIKYIPEGKFFDFGHDLFPKLLEDNQSLYGYKMTEFLLDIGTLETYRLAQGKVDELGFS
ncbi:MAG: NDP-sugar synthase [bacterium]|nr:NDP-sugar synthase [bacterium]